MHFTLPKATFDAMEKVEASEAADLISLARDAGQEVETFFENEDWSGLDLRECDVAGVSFRGANLDGVQVYQDQWDLILATVPASYRDVEPEPRPEEKPFPSEAARDAYAKAERRIEEARQEGANALYLRGHDSERLKALDRLPPQISTLTFLQRLNLTNTQVSDIAPLGGLTALHRLNLDGTQVSNIAPLSRLRALEELNLSTTQVSDLAPLGGLTALKYLNLNGTKVSDIAPLGKLIALQALNLNRTQVSDIAPLGGLASLHKLYLNKTQVSDLAPLGGLTALQEIYLYGTQVSDIVPLGWLTALKRLYLNGTPVKDLSPIQHLIEDGLTVYGVEED